MASLTLDPTPVARRWQDRYDLEPLSAASVYAYAQTGTVPPEGLYRPRRRQDARGLAIVACVYLGAVGWPLLAGVAGVLWLLGVRP